MPNAMCYAIDYEGKVHVMDSDDNGEINAAIALSKDGYVYELHIKGGWSIWFRAPHGPSKSLSFMYTLEKYLPAEVKMYLLIHGKWYENNNSNS